MIWLLFRSTTHTHPTLPLERLNWYVGTDQFILLCLLWVEKDPKSYDSCSGSLHMTGRGVLKKCHFKNIKHICWRFYNYIFSGNRRKRVPGKMMQRKPNKSRRWMEAVGMQSPVEMKFLKTWRRRWAVKAGLGLLPHFPLFSGPGETSPPKCMFPTLSLFGLLECNLHKNNEVIQETVWYGL